MNALEQPERQESPKFEGEVAPEAIFAAAEEENPWSSNCRSFVAAAVSSVLGVPYIPSETMWGTWAGISEFLSPRKNS